ncbi:MAG: hypothetical protein C0617_09600 [Desulfuromonas sp.]|uniref:ATP-binding protein n=1 Tax=Desulfuromonas sp. TaxID=892 RepID=UPI000CA6F77D|nr:ATP-binding protein [Desulfuromonas sp.]PLX83973.1 MAG: hypothetical protein C0617_09600 [Desulfuromonas sp.]
MLKIQNRIGFKLLLAFSVVLVLCLVFVSALNHYFWVGFGDFAISANEQKVKQQAYEFLEGITEERAEKYEAVFQRIAAHSRFIARQAELLYARAGSPPQRAIRADEYLSLYPPNGIFYTDPGEPVMTCYWGGKSIPRQVEDEINILAPLAPTLVEAREKNPEVAASHLIMTSGLGVYYPNFEGVYSLPPVSELDLRDTNNYVMADPRNNPGRKTLWVPVYQDDADHGLITTVTTPIVGRDGAYLGAAGLDLPLENILEQVLGPAHLHPDLKAEGLFSFLLDGRGKIITFPLDLLGDFGLDPNLEALENSLDLLETGLADSSQPQVRALAERILAAPVHTSRLLLGGEPHVVSSHALHSAGWHLVTAVPEAVFLAPLLDLKSTLSQRVETLVGLVYLVLLLFLGAAVLVTVLFSQRVFLNPLKEIADAAVKIGEGDLEVRLDSGRRDEIGILARSFDEMVAGLRRAREMEGEYAVALEDTVEDQTRQLQGQKAALEQTLQILEKDVLKRQKAEEELQYRNALLATQQETSPDGILVVDQDRRIKGWNRNFLDLWTVPEDLMRSNRHREVIEIACSQVRDPDAFKERIQHLYEHLDEQVAGEEIPFRYGRVVERHSRGLVGEDGRFWGRIWFFRDVTERKRTEEQLKALDRIKSEFISTAAHELRTPLTSLMGFTELLLDPGQFGGFSPEQKRDFLAEIYEKGEALRKITDDLLDISRIEAGKPIPMEMAPCDLAGLVEKVAGDFRVSASRHPIELDLDELEGEKVPLDRGKMVQVFENILSNAIKYSPEGGAVRVVGKGVENGVEIAVADDGIGMSPEEVGRVFDKFYRADSSNTAIGGLGLGMSIVRHIVERHGGKIRVESAQGRGTTVFLTLPSDRGAA